MQMERRDFKAFPFYTCLLSPIPFLSIPLSVPGILIGISIEESPRYRAVFVRRQRYALRQATAAGLTQSSRRGGGRSTV